MKTNNAGKDLIKFYEGLPKANKDKKYPPYICPAGYPTLGFGSRYKADGKEVTMKDDAVTLAEANALLDVTLSTYEKAVTRNVKVKLTQNQFDALVSFVYNLGEANFKSSTLLKRINSGDFDGAAKQFLVWNKARVRGTMVAMPGLTKRRASEMNLFLSTVASPKVLLG